MADEPKPQPSFLREVEADIARREEDLRKNPERRNTPEDRKLVEELLARLKKEIRPSFTKQAHSVTVGWELRREEPGTQEQRDTLYGRLIAPLLDDSSQPVRRSRRSPGQSLAVRRRIVRDNRERALLAVSGDDAALADICGLFDEDETIPATRAMRKHGHVSFTVACSKCLSCRRALRENLRRDLHE